MILDLQTIGDCILYTIKPDKASLTVKVYYEQMPTYNSPAFHNKIMCTLASGFHTFTQ